VIANAIIAVPGAYSASLARALYNIAGVLKGCDPQRQLTEDMEDPLWYQELQKIVIMMEVGIN